MFACVLEFLLVLLKRKAVCEVSLCERAALDTPAPISRRDDYCASTGKTPIMCEVFAIATHAGVTSIKDR